MTSRKTKRKRIKLRTRRRACPPVAIIAGALLVVLGIPRFMAAIVQLPADYIPGKMERGETLDRAHLIKLASTRRGANEWVSDGRQWIQLGLAQLRQAEADAGDRGILLQRSVTALRRGLARKPADGRGWMWLAEAELLRGGPTPLVARAIEMSIHTMPYDPRHHMARLEIALSVWATLSARGRAAIADQVRIAGRRHSKPLGELTRQAGYRGLVAKILRSQPAKSTL